MVYQSGGIVQLHRHSGVMTIGVINRSQVTISYRYNTAILFEVH